MTPRHFVATGYVVRDGKTLLLFHKKLQMWLPPGGHIDEGELPEDAARREILEETGLKVEIVADKRVPDPKDGKVEYLFTPNHVQLEHIPGGHPQHIDLIYYCRALDGEAAFSQEEHEGMRWHSIEDLGGAHIAEEVRITGTLAIRHVMTAAPALLPKT